MLNVKKLQAIRDKILGVTVNPNTYGDLNSVVYLQQILDAVKGTDPLNIRGNLAEHIYLQKILNAKRGVVDGQFGSLPNSIYLQQLINAYNGVADGQYGSLSENTYLDALIAVATSSGWTPTYLLRDDFTTAAVAPLTSPRTCEPGPGTITIIDTGNKYSITGGVATPSAASTGINDPVIGTQSFTRVPGLCFLARAALETGSGGAFLYLGSYKTSFVDTNALGVFVFVSPNTLRVPGEVGEVYVNATLYNYAVIARSGGGFFMVRDGKLLYITETGTDTPLLFGFTPRNVNYKTPFVDSYRVAVLPAPWLTDYGIATGYTASPATGATLTHENSCIARFTWTVGAAETLELDLRRTDADNRWIIRCSQAGGTLKIIQRAASVETERASTAQTWTPGTAYRIHVVLNANKIYALVNDAAKGSYTSATFNAGATTAMVSGFATGANFATFPMNLSGTALSTLNSMNP